MPKLLRDVLPQEFFNEHYGSRAANYLDVEVTKEFSRVSADFGDGEWKVWPGDARNVHVWWQLADGHAVGWNENPSLGWSFPVRTVK